MTPQLVDFNADGYQDMVMATFEGTAFLVQGTRDGFKDPVHIKDKQDSLIRISMYWNLDDSEYQYVDRSADGEDYVKEHHMTSMNVVDWDDDGDLDLILGAYEGALYLCLNEGSRSEPSYSNVNRQIKAGGKHLTLNGGLATPITCDWNGDGLFDILCGGSKGGVYYYENVGEKGAPEFAAQQTLIDKLVVDPNSEDYAQSRIVPTVDDQPACPGTGIHLYAADYDRDGDLDLLVGGQSYCAPKKKQLTEQEKVRLEELDGEIAKTQKIIQKYFEDVVQQSEEEAGEDGQADTKDAMQELI